MDYYGLLKAKKTDTPDDIQRKYAKMAKNCHPDNYPNDKQKEEEFKKITEARKVLSDPEMKKSYDIHLKEGIPFNYNQMEEIGDTNEEPIMFGANKIFGGAGNFFQDLFEGFNMNMIGNTKFTSNSMINHISETKIFIKIKDLYNDSDLKISYETISKCKNCDNGIITSKFCKKCKNNRKIAVNDNSRGFIILTDCSDCKCKKCNDGVISVKKNVVCKPSDSNNYSFFKFEEKNDNLVINTIIYIDIEKNNNFSWDSTTKQLFATIPLKLQDLICSFSKEINLPNDDCILVENIGVLDHTENRKIEERGIYDSRIKLRNDLIIKFKLILPPENSKPLINKEENRNIKSYIEKLYL